MTESACKTISEKTLYIATVPIFKSADRNFIEKAFQAMDNILRMRSISITTIMNACLKARRIVKIIRTLQEKGCRVDGFGMQQHYFMRPNYVELKRSIEIYAGLGLRLHVTELDVSLMAVANFGDRRIKPGDPGFDSYIREAMHPTPESLP